MDLQEVADVVAEYRQSPKGIAALINVRVRLAIARRLFAETKSDTAAILDALDAWLQAEAAYGEELLSHAQNLPAPQAAHAES